MPRNDRQLDSRTEVVTPENIAFEYRTAGPFTRLAAFLIDLGVQVLVSIGSVVLFWIAILVIFTVSGVGGAGNTLFSWLANFGAFLIFALWFVMQWFYGAVFEVWWNGQTPGKRAMGLRSLQTDGRPLTVTQAILRNVTRLIDAMPYSFLGGMIEQETPLPLYTYLVGLVAMALTRRHQRLGDLVCGTMVVAEDRSLAGQMEPIDEPALRAMQEAIPANFIPSRTLSKALAHYVGRRRYFGPARRQEIASHVGRVLVERLRLPAQTNHDLLLCALYNRAFGVEPVVADPARLSANGNKIGSKSNENQTAEEHAVASTAESADEPDWEQIPLG